MTAKVSKQSEKFTTQSILIYTYDHTDNHDVYRTYRYLAQLSSQIEIDFIGYKLEIATMLEEDSYLYTAKSFFEAENDLADLGKNSSSIAKKVLHGIIDKFLQSSPDVDKEKKDVMLYREEELVSTLANVLGKKSLALISTENSLIDDLFKAALDEKYIHSRSINAFCAVEEKGLKQIKLKFKNKPEILQVAVSFPEKLFLNEKELYSVCYKTISEKYRDLATNILKNNEDIGTTKETSDQLKPCRIK